MVQFASTVYYTRSYTENMGQNLTKIGRKAQAQEEKAFEGAVAEYPDDIVILKDVVKDPKPNTEEAIILRTTVLSTHPDLPQKYVVETHRDNLLWSHKLKRSNEVVQEYVQTLAAKVAALGSSKQTPDKVILTADS